MNGNSAETGKSIGPKCGVRAQPSSSQGSSTVVAIEMLLTLIMIDMLMTRMVYLLCFFSLYILYALILLLFLQLTFLLAFAFSTLPLMTRVRRFNARKDYLVCIVWVIAGGHYDQGRDSECKAHYYYFYIQQFCLCL